LQYIEKKNYIIPLKTKAQYFQFNDANISKEYEIFEEYIDFDPDHEKNLHSGNFILDRYSDIKSYQHNIVNISSGNGYINASPINIMTNKYFISTQGPKNETVEDFWTMVDEHNCNVIVMLCKEKEGFAEKCATYWDSKRKMQNYQIQVKSFKNENYYIIRNITLINNYTKVEKNIKQIHLTCWPDHGVPDTRDGIIFDVFSQMIKFADENKKDGPIVVHCSAGVGRTGTFISMYILEKEIIKQINDNRKEIKFNIFNLVRKVKEMRLFSVQTVSQYQFIYLFVNYLLNKYNK